MRIVDRLLAVAQSSIFRCLGGLWNIPTGCITKPGASDDGGLNASVFYLPQR